MNETVHCFVLPILHLLWRVLMKMPHLETLQIAMERLVMQHAWKVHPGCRLNMKLLSLHS